MATRPPVIGSNFQPSTTFPISGISPADQRRMQLMAGMMLGPNQAYLSHGAFGMKQGIPGMRFSTGYGGDRDWQAQFVPFPWFPTPQAPAAAAPPPPPAAVTPAAVPAAPQVGDETSREVQERESTAQENRQGPTSRIVTGGTGLDSPASTNPLVLRKRRTTAPALASTLGGTALLGG